MTRTTLDGAGFRAEILQHGDVATIGIQRHNPRTDTWATIQEWDAEVPARARERRLLLTVSARDHGWHFPAEEWTRSVRGRTVLEVIHPDNWDLILRETSARRADLFKAYSELDDVWQHVVVGALDIGHMPRNAVADAVDLSPGRIYQIRAALETANAGE
ncbi:Uncharacterised protein [Mycobacteroides abscessus subsp. abscessus]|nr:Uncharacterised protein [Mycobacteroides abscessus subsp. abscessus]